MTTTYDWLCLTLVQDYALDPTSLTSEASLETLGIDSLAIAELLFNVEDKYNIKVSPEPVPLSTLGDVVRFIDAQVTTQHDPAVSEVPKAQS
jgi:acyl carrier protein